MEEVDLIELGELIRERRIELGYKQTDLEDEVISSSTISNAENGIKIKESKLKHLIDKLLWKYEDIPKYVLERKKKKEKMLRALRLQLKGIENDIYFVGPSFALKSLRKLQIHHYDPYFALVSYLKAKCYYTKGNWEQAKRYYEETLELSVNNKVAKEMNLEAASHYGLGQICYRRSNLLKALEEVNCGLDLFNPKGERKHLRFHLLLSKAIYLEKMDRDMEAIMTLEKEMWPHLDEIDTEVQLNMYELHSALLNKQGLFEEAIRYAEAGIEIARRVKNYNRCFELWTTLGSSYKKMGEYLLAKTCFETALRFEKKVSLLSLVAYNYTELGMMYWEKGKTDMAIDFLQKALKISKKAGDEFREFEVLCALGKCYFEEGKEIEAVGYLELASDFARSNMLLSQEKDLIAYLIGYYVDKDANRHKKYSDRLREIIVQSTKRRGENMTRTRKSVADPPDE